MEHSNAGVSLTIVIKETTYLKHLQHYSCQTRRMLRGFPIPKPMVILLIVKFDNIGVVIKDWRTKKKLASGTKHLMKSLSKERIKNMVIQILLQILLIVIGTLVKTYGTKE
ncbi:hypothetical protein CFOL_v3_06519 [Cephalotus follicularis]|uniref:Uncharacterized protein n=1 Tax=Cephalotus follicularis TaxID=3775 RepID=A0A1Q3B4R3_CEPFO|nr:hypothetical protein CFOL_v3_06519 [Cephalotus follicularis]